MKDLFVKIQIIIEIIIDDDDIIKEDFLDRDNWQSLLFSKIF